MRYRVLFYKMRRVILRMVCVYVLFFMVCWLVYYNISHNTVHVFLKDSLPLDTLDNKSIRIHIYNKPSWLSSKKVEDSCEYKCHITTGKDSYNDSDIVVFHVPSFTERTVPPKKPKGQIWVLYSYESPAGRYTKFSKWRFLFNWTMIMRRDADAPFVNGVFMPKTKFTQKKYIESTYPIKEYFANDPKMMTEIPWASKNKSIGWFVSNCRTASNRETYLKKLSKFINVDIYGRCGMHACRREEIQTTCFDKIIRNYKMYAAFENSLCRDYITEKSYKIYISLLNTIPIVRGGANYSLFLPPGSYINTDDFRDLKSFGKKLQNLDVSDQSSAEFFKWSKHYIPYYARYQPFCELCRRMHQGSEKYKRLYDNVGNFISGDGYKRMCSKPNDLN